MDKFLKNSFLFGGNSAFIEEAYNRYLNDPSSVSTDWQEFFKEFGGEEEKRPNWLKPKPNSVIGITLPEEIKVSKDKKLTLPSNDINAELLIEEFRTSGHLLARLDPLGLEKLPEPHELGLDPTSFGFKPEDMDRKISISADKFPRFASENMTLKQLMNELKIAYSAHIGFEVAHITDKQKRNYLYELIESNFAAITKPEEKKEILEDLIEIEGFEQFIHNRFPGAKRFSVEGGDTSLIALKNIIKTAASSGVKEAIIGMAHRGRLNVLTKIMGKTYVSMLSEFQGNLAHLEEMEISGDVKYHLGRSADINFGGKQVHLSLTPNPSHLETVNPVVMGKVRAKQDKIGDINRSQVMGVLIHGDAAFAGQGVVPESLVMSELDAYNTGGIMHIVINNQVGFTTSPKDARRSRYPTEIAKVIQAPIIHVNGDDAEAVARAAIIAESYRQKFKHDIVLDIVCYRRYGHNEGDEPMFTQPVMYKTIKEHRTTAEIYNGKLINTNVVAPEFEKNKRASFNALLNKAYEESQGYKPAKADWLEGSWAGLRGKNKPEEDTAVTGVTKAVLKKIGKALAKIPEGMILNPKLERLIAARLDAFESGKNFDWGTAEAAAFASLLLDNIPIRMSGQDVKRGTFSHRHAVYFDQNTQNEYIPMNHIEEKQASLEIHNSNLSEYGVLGFEYGYSFTDPKSLVLWEAQFGDFSNGAQIIIDQYVSSSEVKWLRMSGLVMLLPHGYEGQGPEHSSARLERYLQLCAEQNMQVVNITTPANYFHALRRQVARDYRKPLIVMSPKSLLRHKLAVSNIEEMLEGTKFKPVIGDANIKNARRVVICSGKVYYDLLEEREKKQIKDVAIIRLEQLYPFPKDLIQKELEKYKDAAIYWCQEEPENMGAWRNISFKLNDAAGSREVNYVGRAKAASPAAGYMKIHAIEQAKLVSEALSGINENID